MSSTTFDPRRVPPLSHAARADLLRRLGRHAEASRAYARAATSAVSEAERIFLNDRLETGPGRNAERSPADGR